eukprot:TRINITY_DN5338_c0_g1_i2.p1 TRINITY_DN5338_c0_g1~~TRINITY_DN5338_c0_g1_i2.p1  ORF type:complete len:586 (+),score=56.20 TRINITY_DN5338_c0_g1_i2:107-1864(+)
MTPSSVLKYLPFLVLSWLSISVKGIHHEHVRLLEGTLPNDINQSLRPGFHFLPLQNWMNDPNGPLFYKGWYHLFYQFNPDSPVWGNISWGHAVSSDLIQWIHLPVALSRDKWYDAHGVWSGSCTTLSNGIPVIAYTGSTENNVQVLNIAYPANSSDPYLVNWTKADNNPIATPPSGVRDIDFRDPTTAWIGLDGEWRLLLGARRNETDVALLYKSKDFVTWELSPVPVHTANRSGMLECPDIFPVSTIRKVGLDLQFMGFNDVGHKHVLKASFDDLDYDYYAVGTYDTEADTWSPSDRTLDISDGLRFDYGKLYASKSFLDPSKARRILWGWVNESDSVANDLQKGWASVQAIPRVLWLDTSTNLHLLQEPVEEVKFLRQSQWTLSFTSLQPNSASKVDGVYGSQLDIELIFSIPDLTLEDEEGANALVSQGQLSVNSCSTLGATQTGIVGPFGISVLASQSFVERTSIYFEMFPSGENWQTRICSDQTRSTMSNGFDNAIYGSEVRLQGEEKFLTLRILVDNSIIESFAQGGRTVITARAYPTVAVNDQATVWLFNNGSKPVQLVNLSVWEMQSASASSLYTLY